jgi:cytoskeletal protein CcmA (bactofilin family)
MFRRKEEDSPEMTSSAAANPANSNAAPASSAPLAHNDASSASNVSSFAPTAPRPSEPVRPAAPAATAATPYRPAAPAPAESSRPAARPAAETTSRPVAPVSASEKPVKANRRVLTVGNDIILRGEVTTCDRLVIEGKVDAKISDVHTVEIAETGSFKGQAEVEEAEISGTFDGDIIVRGRLVIYSTGKVRGNITYGEIEIERGGEISGEIKTMANASASKGKSSHDDRQKAFAA